MVSIIFDLDGTLVQSAAAIQAVANRLMGEIGLAELNEAEARGYVGNGAEVFLRRALAAREIDETPKFAAWYARFMLLYDEAPGSDCPPFASADGALRELSEMGYKLGLCTNKPTVPSLGVLKAHSWDRLFSAVVAGDTIAKKKPDPAPLHETVRRLGGGPAIYVGDSEVDVETAVAANMTFLLHTEGYRKSPVDALQHRASYSDFADLPALVRAIAETMEN